MPNRDYIIAARETWLKKHPIDSNQMPEGDRRLCEKGTQFFVDAYEPSENGHWKVVLAYGCGTWYLYDKATDGPHSHWITTWEDDVYQEADPQPPTEAIATRKPYKGAIVEIANMKPVYTDQPILEGGNFTWGEATHGGTRVPTTAHAQNIINLAIHLQRARNQIGRQFRVTSWYRPEPWNSRAGGAKRSMHLEGKGVDIAVDGYSGAALAQNFVAWWPGGLGIYPGSRKHILHLDIGPKRKWGF